MGYLAPSELAERSPLLKRKDPISYFKYPLFLLTCSKTRFHGKNVGTGEDYPPNSKEGIPLYHSGQKPLTSWCSVGNVGMNPGIPLKETTSWMVKGWGLHLLVADLEAKNVRVLCLPKGWRCEATLLIAVPVCQL